MSKVACKVKDKRILRLIRRYLQAGMMEHGVESVRTEGTPQGGPLSPLLSNILLDEWDKELEKRGHRFCRYADDCNIYVKSQASGLRVKASLTRYLSQRLKLRVNEKKSAVDRPWKRKFLGYSVTSEREVRLKVASESVKRFRVKIKEKMRQGRGQSLSKTIEALKPLLIGWVNYFRLAKVKSTFEDLDMWLRHRLRNLIWRHWKRPRTRMKGLMKRGIEKERAEKSANNGLGPWWNSKASHMNEAFKKKYFDIAGLVSLLDKIQMLNISTQTAGYGTVCPVV
jgi:RNA-directed DNA polymerase